MLVGTERAVGRATKGTSSPKLYDLRLWRGSCESNNFVPTFPVHKQNVQPAHRSLHSYIVRTQLYHPPRSYREGDYKGGLKRIVPLP